LHEDSLDSEIVYIYVNFEWFGEIQKLQHNGGQKFFFQVFKYLLLLFFPFIRFFFLNLLQLTTF
jgi:hypothetical protein